MTRTDHIARARFYLAMLASAPRAGVSARSLTARRVAELLTQAARHRAMAAALAGLVLHLAAPAPLHARAEAPACQVHVWDGDPPYDCHAPAAVGDDA